MSTYSKLPDALDELVFSKSPNSTLIVYFPDDGPVRAATVRRCWCDLEFEPKFQVDGQDVEFDTLEEKLCGGQWNQEAMEDFVDGWTGEANLCAEGLLDLGCAWVWSGRPEGREAALSVWNDALAATAHRAEDATSVKDKIQRNIARCDPTLPVWSMQVKLESPLEKMLVESKDPIGKGEIPRVRIVDAATFDELAPE
jgi:hypothetical protein